MNKDEMLEQKSWAVLGATAKKEKFGYKIYRCLKDHGYDVYPVNPGIEMIDGEMCYKSLDELPITPQVVNFVVPESVGLIALEECKKMGVNAIWLQPGADKPTVLEKAHSLELDIVQGCVLVELR